MKITTNLDDVVRQFHKFVAEKEAQLKKASEMTPRQVGRLVKNEVIDAIRKEKLVASGSLLKSISVTGLRASTQMSEATVGSSSPYAKYVEEGVRAGGKMPPVNEIYQWMINKGIEPSESGAYLIARKIRDRGIPPKKVFEQGVHNAEGKIDYEINIILNKTLTKN